MEIMEIKRAVELPLVMECQCLGLECNLLPVGHANERLATDVENMISAIILQ